MSGPAPGAAFDPWRQMRREAGFWVALVGLAGALLFGGSALPRFVDSRQLAAQGVDTFGTVIDRSISGPGASTRYRLTVRFAAGDGAEATVTFAVSRLRYVDSYGSQRVALRYLPRNPSVAELERGDRVYETAVLGGFAAVFGLVAVLGALTAGARVASQGRALARGERRRARVVAHRRASMRVRRQVQAEWQDSAGGIGRTRVLVDAESPPAGAQIEVAIDPRSGRGWWLGDPRLRDTAADLGTRPLAPGLSAQHRRMARCLTAVQGAARALTL